MNIEELLTKLRELDVFLWAEDGNIRYQAPKGVMTKEMLAEISQNKQQILAFLKQADYLKHANEPIVKVENKLDCVPLSFSQQSLWIFDKLNPGNSIYNIPNAIRIYGDLNIRTLEMSVNLIIRRHEILRMSFLEIDGKPVQKISEPQRFSLTVTDLSDHEDTAREGKLQEILRKKAWESFDLVHGPIWRMFLVKMADYEYVIAFTIHHILSDAWSNGVIVREILQAYESLSGGQDGTLPDLPIQFSDYVYWQKRFLRKEISEPLVDFWKLKLDGYEMLQLPTDKRRPLIPDYKGKTETCLLPSELNEKIKSICQAEDITTYMFLLTAFEILLSRYSGQDDIVLGTVVANRNRTELTGIVGFIMNTIVIRDDLSGNPTVKELMRKVKASTVDAYAYQGLPFDMLLEEIKPERDPARTPIFQVMYMHQNINNFTLEAKGLRLEEIAVENEISPFDLRLSTRETANGIECRLDYSSALYEAHTACDFLRHYKNVITGMCADTSIQFHDIKLMDDDELQLILEDFNESHADFDFSKTVYQLFEDQARIAPERIALSYEEREMTYGELNQKANKLARLLRRHGVGPDRTVGICLERSFEMIISLLAVLKSGGAYIPIDPHFPDDRVRHILQSAKAPVIITDNTHRGRIAMEDVTVLCADSLGDELVSENSDNLEIAAGMDNLAYVIYTSGSTGAPKGTMNTHRGMLNHKFWMQREFPITPDDILFQKTPFSFDVSVWEFFWPLMYGSKLVIAKPEGHKDPSYLAKTIIKERITIVHFVPSMLRAFLDEPLALQCNSLTMIVCSGEALDHGLLCRAKDTFNIPVYNVYGPAECADVATMWECDCNYKNQLVPIGKPISNVRTYILDEYRMPVPVGVYGEIYVGGIGVGKGYICNKSLTDERFIRDPFVVDGSNMYKTGDVGRYLPDGNIDYMGRSDFQVKIRGVRIELGEIEKNLIGHPSLKNCAVIVWGNEAGNQHLVAYVVAEQGQFTDSGELRKYLAKKLPDHMVPKIYVVLDKLPLNNSGKLDKKALPAPDFSKMLRSQEYAPAQNETESVLTTIWRETLELDEIGVHDNFFEIGGHSLLLVQVHKKITEHFKKDFSLIELFTYSTISTLAAFLSGETEDVLVDTSRLARQKNARNRHKQIRGGAGI